MTEVPQMEDRSRSSVLLTITKCQGNSIGNEHEHSDIMDVGIEAHFHVRINQ